MLQNGKMPQFLSGDVIQSLFEDPEPSPSILMLRKGLSATGIYQVSTLLDTREKESIWIPILN